MIYQYIQTPRCYNIYQNITLDDSQDSQNYNTMSLLRTERTMWDDEIIIMKWDPFRDSQTPNGIINYIIEKQTNIFVTDRLNASYKQSKLTLFKIRMQTMLNMNTEICSVCVDVFNLR